MRVRFKNTPNTHFFTCFPRRFLGGTLCLEPSERIQFFIFGVSDYRLTKHSLTIRNIRGTIFLMMRMHGLKKFASIHASFHNLFNLQRSLARRSTFKINYSNILDAWCPIEISLKYTSKLYWCLGS